VLNLQNSYPFSTHLAPSMPKRDGKVEIWPAYLDAEKSRGEGRKIPKRDAISNPTPDDILIAALEMNLKPEAERDKRYPKYWWENSWRVVVLKNAPKTVLMKEIASRIKRRQKDGKRKVKGKGKSRQEQKS